MVRACPSVTAVRGRRQASAEQDRDQKDVFHGCFLPHTPPTVRPLLQISTMSSGVHSISIGVQFVSGAMIPCFSHGVCAAPNRCPSSWGSIEKNACGSPRAAWQMKIVDGYRLFTLHLSSAHGSYRFQHRYLDFRSHTGSRFGHLFELPADDHHAGWYIIDSRLDPNGPFAKAEPQKILAYYLRKLGATVVDPVYGATNDTIVTTLNSSPLRMPAAVPNSTRWAIESLSYEDRVVSSAIDSCRDPRSAAPHRHLVAHRPELDQPPLAPLLSRGQPQVACFRKERVLRLGAQPPELD